MAAAAASSANAGQPLSSVPVLNSRPGAAANIILDFDGEPATTWLSYSVPVTPAFDQDGDATTFSSGELASINEIWARVSEAYSIFNVNVTTVAPSSLQANRDVKAIIGGNGSWVGAPSSGIAWTNTFKQSWNPRTVYVFPDAVGKSTRFTAEVAAHEIGHHLGLQHQSAYSGSTKTAEYNPGNSSQAPIMGVTFNSARATWWSGPPSDSWSSIQSDLAVLGAAIAPIADEAGGSVATAATASVTSGTVLNAGRISSAADADYYSFTTAAGTVTFTANVAPYGAMLDAKLELRDASNNLIASANTTSLSETLTATVAAGTYYVVVASAGNYGDVGQYTLTGTLPTASSLAISPGSGYSVPEGSSVVLAATVTSGTAASFAWDLDGDGIYGETGASATRGNEVGANVTFSAIGLDGPSAFTVGLRVTGTDGSVVSATTPIAITNVPPTLASAAAPLGTINEGSPLTLSFVAYDPGDDTISSWLINWGDGSSVTLPGTATSATRTYADDGVYTITITATDEDGSYTVTRTVNVANVAPTLSFNAPTSVYEGTNATFTFSATDPGQDTISNWLINWGDGTSATYAGTVASATKKYADDGTYVVTLTATDEDGTYSITRSVTVLNVAPTLTLSAPTSANEGSPISLTFGASDPGTDTISAWLISWGDGTTTPLAGTATGATKTYADNGVYTITLTATDEDGTYSTTRSVTILNVAPTLALTVPASLNEGSFATFVWSATDPGQDTISAWHIDWGDGTSSSLAGTVTTTTKKYADDGHYTVTLTATDEDGSYSITRSVTVLNVAPTLTLTVPATVPEASNFSISFAASDPGQDTIASWVINWGDGSTPTTKAGSAATAAKTYATRGTYTITLTATDEDGSYSTTRSIVVSNVAPTLSLTLPASVNEGQSFGVTFAGTVAGLDPITGWSINWGDGTPATALAAAAASASKTYADDGTYSVTLTATDSAGSYSIVRSIVVNNVAPTLTFSGPSTADEGSPVPFTFSAVDPGADTISSWAIDWGDGLTTSLAGTASGYTKTFADDGDYTIRLTATDEDGSYVATRTIHVNNVPPIITVTASADWVSLGATFAMSVAGPVSNVAGWQVDWGNGSVQTYDAETRTFEHVYDEPGHYAPVLSAVDADGVASIVDVGSVAVVALPTATIDPLPTLLEPTTQMIVDVTYASPRKFDVTAFKRKDLALDGFGDDVTVKMIDASTADGGFTWRVRYTLNRAAAWSYKDDGAYGIRLKGGVVADLDGRSVSAAPVQFDMRARPYDGAGNDFDAARDLGNFGVGRGRNAFDYVGPWDKSDFYRFRITESGITTIRMNGLQDTADLKIFDGYGNQVAAANRGGASNESLELELPKGYAFIRVYDTKGQGTPYTLRVEQNARPAPAYEVGDVIGDPVQLGTLEPGKVKRASGTIGGSDQNDYYRFRAAFRGRVSLSLTGLTDDADLELIDGSSNTIASSTRRGTLSESISLTVSGGWYYVRVLSPAGSPAVKPYRLDVRAA